MGKEIKKFDELMNKALEDFYAYFRGVLDEAYKNGESAIEANIASDIDDQDYKYYLYAEYLFNKKIKMPDIEIVTKWFVIGWNYNLIIYDSKTNCYYLVKKGNVHKIFSIKKLSEDEAKEIMKANMVDFLYD